MQNKTQSKSRLPQYYSIKEYESVQQCSKKMIKPHHQKSAKKLKTTKSTMQSQSKGKHSSKIIKNNQNFNSVNIATNDPHKTKSTHNQHEILKKENRCEEKLKRNSSEKLIKTKSVSKIQLKSQRKAVSPSPLNIRETQSHLEQKAKISRNATSRSEKQKKSTQRSKQEPQLLKKSGSKQVLTSKSDHFDRSTRNRVSIKTEMSSKTHSVMKEQDKTKRSTKVKSKKTNPKEIKSQRNRPYKMPKPSQTKIESIVQRSILYSEVSFQEYNGEHPYESAFVSNQKYFLPYPQLKSVKTQGCQVQNKSNHSLKSNDPRLAKAAIKIQKLFRGYITRKYIDEAKYIISKVKIIQAWWRQLLHTKKQRLNQKISSSNSLITIKDFNDTFKTDRQKLFSESKENTLSNHKINFKELIKNILEENEESQNHSDLSIDKQDSIDMSRDKNLSNVSKDVYVELKIQDEITSERKFNFNSPKSLGSPTSAMTPTNCMFNIKEMFGGGGNSNEKQKIKELLQSPRMTSPQQLKTTPQKIHQQEATVRQAANKELIEPFETNFAIIEQFCLLTVNYFRDKPHEMQAFISKLQSLKEFRTNLILRTWNSHTLCSQEQFSSDETILADYQYLQTFQKPNLFDKLLREDILHFPQIEIDLSGKRFNLQSPTSAPVHRAFLQFAFDALEEAFYEQHKISILTYGKSLNKYIFQNEQSLFEHYFSSALGELFKWGEMLCGLLADLPPQQEMIKQQRMKQFLKPVQSWDLGLSDALAIKIQLSEQIMLMLFSQFQDEFLKLC